MLGTLAVAGATVPLLGAIMADTLPPAVLWGFAAPATVTALTSVLLAERLASAARLAQRRAGALDEQATVLNEQANALQRALAQQRTLQLQLTHRAQHEPLTGLANRALLAERLREALPNGAALLLLDLDGFKDINDTLGHPAGDEMLVEVAERLRPLTRDTETLSRLGGDEFALLLPGASRERALQVAQSALEALSRKHRHGDREIHLTASIGLLVMNGRSDTNTAAAALRDADLALYAAKGAGKNQVMEFHPRLREDRLRHTRLVAGLRRALADDELTLHFQPVVDVESGAPVAVEALVRWHPPGATMIPPAQFIPVAEETGLVVPLGTRVLRDACTQAAHWYRRYGVAMTVNVSGRQLRDPHFADLVLAILSETGLPGEALILEITETVLVASTGPDDQMIERLQRLRRHGVQVAIDDFGTGYSSLSYLHQLPIDILKIDHSFTESLDQHAPERQRGASFARAILSLGQSLQLRTIAEGVETPRQAQLLAGLGCPLAQGFLYAEPASANDITQYLARAEWVTMDDGYRSAA